MAIKSKQETEKLRERLTEEYYTEDIKFFRGLNKKFDESFRHTFRRLVEAYKAQEVRSCKQERSD